MARYHTNLAAEFYVLSCLHRAGLDAHRTLGNRKGVEVGGMMETRRRSK